MWEFHIAPSKMFLLCVLFYYVVRCLLRTALQDCCEHLARRAASIRGSEGPVLTSQLRLSSLWLSVVCVAWEGQLKDCVCVCVYVCSVSSLNCHRVLKGSYCQNITQNTQVKATVLVWEGAGFLSLWISEMIFNRDLNRSFHTCFIQDLHIHKKILT